MDYQQVSLSCFFFTLLSIFWEAANITNGYQSEC
jgi:hypothetical protein